MPDQYLLCRGHDGSLLNVAQILGSGIELQGRIISLENFQELLGPKAYVTFIDGRLADSSSISAAISAAANNASHQQPLLEDENDEFCLICSLGGDLICCETCPATFHTECIGLSEVPLDDWFCPACRCCPPASNDGGGGRGGGDAKNETTDAPTLLASPELIPCSNYSSHRLPTTNGDEEKEDKFSKEREDHGGIIGQISNGGGAGGGSPVGSKKRPIRSKLWSYPKVHLEEAGKPPPLYTIQIQKQRYIQLEMQQEEGKDDQVKISGDAAADGGDGGGVENKKITSDIKPTIRAFRNEAENEKEEAIARALGGAAEKTKKEKNEEEYYRQKSLAECCALGEIPIAKVYAANKPIQISFQLINTAAAAGTNTDTGLFNNGKPATTTLASALDSEQNMIINKMNSNSGCSCMVMPGYTETQRSELHHVLSAALHLVRSVYMPLLDSRTGCDVLPWLFRGKTFFSGCADYSTMHVAVLYVGSTIAGVACVRSLGNKIAEIPIFTIRKELRRNCLGEHFLSQIEKVLHQGGIELIITPAMILPGWPFTPSSVPRENEHEDHQNGKITSSSMPVSVQTNAQPPPLPMQSRWGYTLASKEEMQKIAQVRPLAFPGIYTCVKWLSSSTQTEMKTKEAKAVAAVETLPGELAAPAPEATAVRIAGKSEKLKSPLLTSTPTTASGVTNHANTRNNPLIPRSLPVSLTIPPEINVGLLRDMGFIEFRCDQGTSSLIPVDPSPGFELVIRTSAEDTFYTAATNNNITNTNTITNQGGGGGSRGGGGDRSTNGNGTGTDRSTGSDLHQKKEPYQQTMSPASQQRATGKRKYTKKKLKGEDAGGGGGGGSPKKIKGKTIKIPAQQPQHVQMQQQVGGGQQGLSHNQISAYKDHNNMPQFGVAPYGGVDAGGAAVLQNSQYQGTYSQIQPHQQQQQVHPMGIDPAWASQLPPGVPILQSLVHSNQSLNPLSYQQQQYQQQHHHQQQPAVADEYAAMQHVQIMQAQQLAEMEDAILRKQTSLLQGMAVFREQQQQLTFIQQQQQQQYNSNPTGYVVNQTINQNNGMIGEAAAAAGVYPAIGNQGQQQQQYFQQQFDDLPPLQSIYESHQQRQRQLQEQQQQQQQQFQNAATIGMQAPPPAFEPGYLYHLSSQPPLQPQQQLNPLMPSQGAPSSYYYGNGSGGNGS